MRKLAAPLVLFLLCVGFYWKLTLTNQYTFLDSPDLANLDLPRLQFQATAWRHAYFPLWDPYHWVGQPFLGQVTGAAYPANWLLAVFPFREGKLSLGVVHWYLVLLHFQAALFCFLLCRDWKRSRTASVLGGLVFALGGFIGNTDWPQILNGALWLPLIFLFLFRALRGKRALFSAAMSGALLGLAWLSGHHEAPIYASVAVGATWLGALLPAAGRWRVARLGAAAALATALIAALQVIPAQEYAPLSKRWVGLDHPVGWNEPIPYEIHQHYSWMLTALPGVVTPRPPVHVDPFIGIAAFMLVLLGVYQGWRLPQVRLLVLVAAGGLLIALATSSFLHGVLYAALPVFGKARVPARALCLFSFAVAPLAAYGLDALRRRTSVWLRWAVWVLAALGTGVFLTQTQSGPLVTATAALTAAALLAGWRAGALTWRTVSIAMTLLAMIEISNVSGTALASRVSNPRPGYIDRLYQHTDIANFLRAQPQPIRVEVADADIPYNFGDWHGIPTLGGFAASATTNLLDLERHKPRVQDLLGVNYYVGRTAPRGDLLLLTDSSSGFNVYRNPSALPRVWAVHRASRIATVNDVNTRLDDAAFDPRTEALLLSEPPALQSCEGDEVRMEDSRTPNRARITAKMACRGLVILSDTWFPGWQAKVDGRPAEILPAFGTLRGVVVEAGEHRIEYAYAPASAAWGAALTALGVLFVLGTGMYTAKLKKR